LATIAYELEAQGRGVTIGLPELHEVIRAFDSVSIDRADDVSHLHSERHGDRTIGEQAQDLKSEEAAVSEHRSKLNLLNEPRGTLRVGGVPGFTIDEIQIFLCVSRHERDLPSPSADLG
jgi:hypothetical protein